MKTLVALFFALFLSLHANADVWKPTGERAQFNLWPDKIPDASEKPGSEVIEVNKNLIGGKTVTAVKNVSVPTLTFYEAKGKNSGATFLVIPGGGFEILAIDLEGTEICDLLVSRGINCALLKYRVPSLPYDWHSNSRPHNDMISTESLEDVQRAMGLIRSHSEQWKIDPAKVGVIGFSAGGYLVAEISNVYSKRLYASVDAADKESCRPDFAAAIYPGHLSVGSKKKLKFNPNIHVTGKTPSTFIIQAEDDYTDGISQSLAYYFELKNANVPAEMHLFAEGGHAFGVRTTKSPITNWAELMMTWLKTVSVIAN